MHALAEYTVSGGKEKPALDQEIAVAKMLEYYEPIEYHHYLCENAHHKGDV